MHSDCAGCWSSTRRSCRSSNRSQPRPMSRVNGFCLKTPSHSERYNQTQISLIFAERMAGVGEEFKSHLKICDNLRNLRLIGALHQTRNSPPPYTLSMTAYARHEHHDFVGGARQALTDPPLQAALVRLTGTLMAANRRGYAALADSDQLRDHAKRIKEHTLARLDRYLEQLEASVQRLGGQVHWAATAEEARQAVLAIARKAGCRRA